MTSHASYLLQLQAVLKTNCQINQPKNTNLAPEIKYNDQLNVGGLNLNTHMCDEYNACIIRYENENECWASLLLVPARFELEPRFRFRLWFTLRQGMYTQYNAIGWKMQIKCMCCDILGGATFLHSYLGSKERRWMRVRGFSESNGKTGAIVRITCYHYSRGS